MSETLSLPYPTVKFKDETAVLDWALSAIAFRLTDTSFPSPSEAFPVFENLVRLKLGQTLGEAVQADLENMNARIKHLEAATATREWNPLGKTEKVRP